MDRPKWTTLTLQARDVMIEKAHGAVLEVGVGTGLNLLPLCIPCLHRETPGKHRKPRLPRACREEDEPFGGAAYLRNNPILRPSTVRPLIARPTSVQCTLRKAVGNRREI